ncbi:MAG: 5'-3' exonuclease [Persephonella sp.]|nr:MAG: 5'-3' exonuclease [Persephonella sp.]
MKKLVLIDGSSYVYRAFYALPPLKSPKGEPTGAIYGFIRMLSSLIKELNPDYIAVAFDLSSKTFRQEKVKSYKATRRETPDLLKEQIPKIKEILRLWGIKILEKEGFEADDIIATLVNKFKNNYEIIIVSPDKDMLQLVDKNVKLYNPMQNILYDVEKVKEKYGIYPNQFVDYQAIVGDNVDNIKGVKGVGKKTAAELLNKYGNLEEILANLDNLKPKIREAFKNSIEDLKNARFLVKLRDDVEIDISIDDLQIKNTNWEKLKEVFEELGFKSLLKNLKELRLEEGNKPLQKSLF